MLEDDDYRSSSQYRCWSYSPQKLDEIRRTTNSIAAEKVRVAFRRARQNDNTAGDESESAIQTLSIEEELRIVEWGSDKIVQMGQVMKPRIPPNIVATAIQYLRRFYLTNSPMTYHPRQITACALYLATKADHFYISLHEFVNKLDNVTEEDVKAPEFLLMQGLRFTLDVRHPMRGLDGGIAELQALANEGRMGSLQRTVNGKQQTASQRIGAAADKSKELLRTAAQMTDAYFVFTPAQIWLGAMFATDEEMTVRYLDYFLSQLGQQGSDISSRLQSTIRSCGELLSAYKSAANDPQKEKDIRKVGRKLKNFQNPENLDLPALARAKAAEKREGSDSDGGKALKKRKLERERLEKDGDVFGPDLK